MENFSTLVTELNQLIPPRRLPRYFKTGILEPHSKAIDRRSAYGLRRHCSGTAPLTLQHFSTIHFDFLGPKCKGMLSGC